MADQPELRTVDQLLAVLDNGEFLQNFLTEHAALIVAMTNHQLAHGGKVKGKVVLTLDYALTKQLSMTVEGTLKVDKPKAPKASANVWTTADGALTPQNPQQPSLFGVRDVTPIMPPMRG